jgi:hypothetical protein
MGLKEARPDAGLDIVAAQRASFSRGQWVEGVRTSTGWMGI